MQQRLRKLAVFLLAVVLVTVLPAWVGATELAVHIIDIGQGDAIAISSPTGKWVLIDGGEAGPGRRTLVPYLQGQGVDQLELMVMTHPHADHIGGLLPVVENFPIKSIIADGQIHTSATYERLLLAIKERQIPFSLARRGQVYELGGGALLTVLHPQELLYDDLNNNSVVLRLDFGEVAFLFTGDAETPAELEMIEANVALDVDVLKVGHHGSITSTSPEFLQVLSPTVAVISVGAGNRYNHPSREVIQRLEASGVTVYRTDVHGTVVIATDGSQLTVTSQRGKETFTGKGPSTSPGGIQDSRLDLNTATLDELLELPGVGPVLAERIIAHRRAKPFKSVDELLQIKGIGAKTLENLKPWVKVD
ncbi:MAG: MBL fold metallo-hydrolase [Firmicutes bacterium]|nr:MBL fold metallo-hydrolase [Bacillota bacterium]